MRNITVSVDDATYRRARIRAAELDTSVSALVREYLSGRTGGLFTEQAAARRQESHEAYLKRLNDFFADWDARGVGLRGFHRMTREEVHDRQRARLEARLAVAEREREMLAMELSGLDARAAESSASYQVGTTDEEAES